MEENNILNKGVYILHEIRADIARNDELKGMALTLAENEKKYTKNLEATKKAEATEINTTISKRRSDIENSFAAQLGQTRSRMKKAQTRRSNEKNNKVNKRIKDETEDLRENIRSTKEDIRAVFSSGDISKIFNNNFFLTLFRPTSLGEFGILALIVVLFAGVPVIIYNLIPKENPKTVLWVILYIVYLVGLMVGYIALRKKVYTANRKSFDEIYRLRNRIQGFKRRIKKKEQAILSDENESGYELERFDAEIDEIQQQIDHIIDEKKAALTLFENDTKRNIANEIHTRYATEIEDDGNALEACRQEKHAVDTELNELTVRISKNYEPYLGKEVLSVSVIDALIDIIENGNAETVAEALDYYRKTIDKGLQTV